MKTLNVVRVVLFVLALVSAVGALGISLLGIFNAAFLSLMPIAKSLLIFAITVIVLDLIVRVERLEKGE